MINGGGGGEDGEAGEWGEASRASLWTAEALNLQCDECRTTQSSQKQDCSSLDVEDSNLNSFLETSLFWWHLAVFKSLLGFRRFLGLRVVVMGPSQQPRKADFILSILGLVSGRSHDWD